MSAQPLHAHDRPGGCVSNSSCCWRSISSPWLSASRASWASLPWMRIPAASLPMAATMIARQVDATAIERQRRKRGRPNPGVPMCTSPTARQHGRRARLQSGAANRAMGATSIVMATASDANSLANLPRFHAVQSQQGGIPRTVANGIMDRLCRRPDQMAGRLAALQGSDTKDLREGCTISRSSAGWSTSTCSPH